MTKIPCRKLDGLFKGEAGVELNIGDMVISLFVDSSYLTEENGDYYLLVERIDEDFVRLPGERIDFGQPVIEYPK